MAIVINGSGTISGLAVGGLPDGTVDDGTVASGIAASKLTGALPAINGASLTNLSILSEVDQWRISSTYTGTTAFLTANWERNDTTFEVIGTGLTESSGVFTFPSTGKYLIKAQANMRDADGERSAGIQLYVTTNNSDYVLYADANGSLSDVGGADNTMSHANCEAIVDVTSVTNIKFKLRAFSGSSIQFDGSSTAQYTGVTTMRLGDT